MRFRQCIVTAFLVVLAAAVVLLPAGPAAAQKAQKVYGKGIDRADTVRIATVLENPGEYVGRTVRVEGTVVGCCKMRGCWIDLASDRPFEKIQIKVDDGEIVFPMEIMGERVRAEGVVEAVPLTQEQAVAYLGKEASCQKEAFDPATVPAEGVTIYRIHGTGALVLPADAPIAPGSGVEGAAAAGEAPAAVPAVAPAKPCPHESGAVQPESGRKPARKRR